VQVEFLLHPVMTAFQIPEDSPADTRAHETQFVPGLQVRGVHGIAEEVPEHGHIVLPSLLGTCDRGRRAHIRLVMLEAPDLADGAKKMSDVVRVFVWIHHGSRSGACTAAGQLAILALWQVTPVSASDSPEGRCRGKRGAASADDAGFSACLAVSSILGGSIPGLFAHAHLGQQ
jgi:hypothetical protein